MAFDTKVLVLDDEKDVCEGIVEYLDNRGLKTAYCLTIDDFH